MAEVAVRLSSKQWEAADACRSNADKPLILAMWCQSGSGVDKVVVMHQWCAPVSRDSAEMC